MLIAKEFKFSPSIFYASRAYYHVRYVLQLIAPYHATKRTSHDGEEAGEILYLRALLVPSVISLHGNRRSVNLQLLIPRARVGISEHFHSKMFSNSMHLDLARKELQRSAKVGAPGLVNFTTALAYHFCPSLPAAIMQLEHCL